MWLCAGRLALPEAEERMFFFEKKNQKTFIRGVRFRRVRDSQ
jgi:hypothetical protein